MRGRLVSIMGANAISASGAHGNNRLRCSLGKPSACKWSFVRSAAVWVVKMPTTGYTGIPSVFDVACIPSRGPCYACPRCACSSGPGASSSCCAPGRLFCKSLARAHDAQHPLYSSQPTTGVPRAAQRPDRLSCSLTTCRFVTPSIPQDHAWCAVITAAGSTVRAGMDIAHCIGQFPSWCVDMGKRTSQTGSPYL
jgi:hypothetical protein